MFLQVYTLQDYGVTEDNVSSFPNSNFDSVVPVSAMMKPNVVGPSSALC